MSDGPALSLQAALIAHLRADPDIGSLVSGRIYDEPPEAAQRPFIRINEISIQPARSSCRTDWKAPFSLEVHSRPIAAGRVEATRIAEAVAASLDGATLAVSNYPAFWLELVTYFTVRAGDGKSYLAEVLFDTELQG